MVEHLQSLIVLFLFPMVLFMDRFVLKIIREIVCLEKFLVLLMQPVTELQLLDRIQPPTEDLKKKGIDFSLWFKPDKYPTDF